jgi:glutaredoxin
MRATIYTKDNCPYCVKVKQVLQMIRAEVTEYTYGKDFTREQFYDEFGQGSTFPQVILDEEHVGGCTETVKLLKERGLV